MILEHVTLRDFCLFRGEQTFDLTPVPAPRNAGMRPIVLFGGVNGAGKTTLLDAIQLALYGPRARCSKRANLAYDEFLRKSIHHGVSESEGAGVVARVPVRLGRRRARLRGPSVLERAGRQGARGAAACSLDGLPDRWHSEHWSQLVEDFFPLEVSQLFFFDAEKIRSLAEDETSSQVLGTAVKSLLGLDIAERLIADAAVAGNADLTKEAWRPPSRARTAPSSRREIEQLAAELDAMKTKRERARERPAADRERSRSGSKRSSRRRAAGTGKHAATASAGSEELKQEIDECESRLVALAATELPLCLVDDLLERVERQDERERLAAEAEVVRRLLAERDDRLAGPARRG